MQFSKIFVLGLFSILAAGYPSVQEQSIRKGPESASVGIGPVADKPVNTTLVTTTALSIHEDFLDGWTLAGVWAGIKIAWATKTLVQNLFDIPKECGESTFDCLFQVGNTLMSYFALGYQAYSNLPDMERDGVAVFAITNLSDGTYIGSHLPVSDDSAVTQRDLSITRPNLKTWAHVATRYTDDGMPLHSIYHRLVSDEDLGRPNDGTSHHLIVQTANLTAPWEKKTRLNARADSSNSHGVVGEYLWQNNDNSLWGDLHNACSGTLENQCDLGSSLANKFESEQSEVGCAVPGVAKGDGSYAGLDSGLFAYGWNDKAFDFQGRAGSWLDGCAPAPRRCSPNWECTEGPHNQHCRAYNCDCDDGFTVPYKNQNCQS